MSPAARRPPPNFVRTGPSLARPNPSFLSEPDLGLEPQKPKFCPNRDPASKGIIRGPRSTAFWGAGKATRGAGRGQKSEQEGKFELPGQHRVNQAPKGQIS